MTMELWPGGPLIRNEEGVFKVGADSVLLADFTKGAAVRKRKRAVDLGCGSGIISILLALNDPGLLVDGVEIEKRAVTLAVENTQLCKLADRIMIIEGDLRRHRDFLRSGVYDIAVSNPPYIAVGSGKRSASEDFTAARCDETCTLDDLCGTAAYLTRWGGSFFLVHKPERLSEIFRALSANGLEPKRMRFVQHKQASPPNLVLIESRRGGNPSLIVEAPLVLYNDDGGESDEAKSIYRRN